MSDPDQELKEGIAKHLEDLGFMVTLLEEEEVRRTPDLLATKKGQRFLIEVKAKGDDLGALLERQRMLAEGDLVIHGARWAPKNTISGIARDGAFQLSDHPPEERDFSLLWLHAEGSDPQSQFEQFAFTLYGKTHVYSVLNPQFNYECYFFYDSVFYRWRDILDGAILSTPTEAQLCSNTYCPRYSSFQNSELVKAFDQAVIDPIKLERAGHAIVADCDIDRKDHDKVKQYLAAKYAEKYLDHMHVGRISLGREFTIGEAAPNPGPEAGG